MNMYKTLFSLLTIIGTALSTLGQSGQTAIFYEITGRRLTKPSYILGTFHAICPTDMLPIEKLTPFLDKTDQMFLELDMDDPAVMTSMARGLAMPAGKTLKDLYTDEEYSRIDALLRSSVGIPVDMVKTIRPSMLAVMVATSTKTLGCTPKAVDTVVMEAAVARKKPILGIETVEAQMAVLNSQPIEKQAKELLKMATDPTRSITEIKSIMAVYKAQDAEGIFKVTTTQMAEEKAFQTVLLDNRNKEWIPKLESAMAAMPTFFAVGAGHLGGKAGVVNLLRQKGYKLKPIRL